MDKQQFDDGAFNTALGEVFTIRKDEPSRRMTYEVLSTKSGVKVRQLKYLLSGTRGMSVGEMLSIARALDLDPGQVVEDAAARAEKISK